MYIQCMLFTVYVIYSVYIYINIYNIYIYIHMFHIIALESSLKSVYDYLFCLAVSGDFGPGPASSDAAQAAARSSRRVRLESS